MEINANNYIQLCAFLDIDGLKEAVNNLIINGPEILEQLGTGFLSLDPVLVALGLSNLLPILLKIFCKAAFFTIVKKNKKKGITEGLSVKKID